VAIPEFTSLAIRFDNAYITWINDGKKAWTIYAGGVAADPRVEISARPVPQEPMVRLYLSPHVSISGSHHRCLPINQYILANLGFSLNFGGIDLEHITFPAAMSIDWIRVYQPQNAINIGCDPKDFPTAAYIQTSVVFPFPVVSICGADLGDADIRRFIRTRT
jgi:Beta-glucan synthesis-associated protein SKN1/KRE6/Sbg1